MRFKLNDQQSKLFKGADELKNQEIQEIDYLVDRLIPRGTLCTLVGESDTGKSSLLRQLAVSVAYGDDTFLGLKLNDNCRSVVYVIKFNENLSFEPTGKRVNLDDLDNPEYLGKAKELLADGKSYREISEALNQMGFMVSKSTLQRKLK